MSAVISPIRDRTNSIVGISAVVRDITRQRKEEAERRVLEERTNQSHRLESLGQLAGGVAHDFNNLLAVIMNYASFVRDGIADVVGDVSEGHWADVVGDIDQVSRAAERAAKLAHQLLAFARSEDVEPEVVNVNDIVGEIGKPSCVAHRLARTLQCRQNSNLTWCAR